MRNGEAVTLTPKALEALVMLVQKQGRLVEKEDLMAALWPDTFVEEANLAHHIWRLRRALNDKKRESYIETIPKRGYRFVASVSKREGSLAVLPFQSLTELADPALQVGMADGIISRLSNLRELTVRPTSAVLKYTGNLEDLSAIGRELQVDSILAGTIQRGGDRLRLSVQLIRVEDGRSTWAEQFDENATDIFSLQDALSEKVARALAIRLTGNELTRMRQNHSADTEAYQSYLKGRYKMYMGAEGAIKAVEFFQDCIGRDPNFAPAYAAMANAYSILGFMGVGAERPGDQFEKARAASMKAIELDDSLADAHTSLGNVFFSYDWKWDAAEKEFKRAIELNPNSSEAHHLYSQYLMAMTRWNEALAEIRRAHELDPLSLMINFRYGLCLALMGREDEALTQYRKTLDIDSMTGGSGSHWGIAMVHLKRRQFMEAIRELEAARQADPRPSWRLLNLAEAYGRAGKRKEASALLSQILQMQETEWISPTALAMVYAALGDSEQAFRWWNKAIDERETYVIYIKAMDVGDLRADSRYTKLLERIGLA